MATNRDDFIIAIRSAFLKKGNQQRFSLIGLILFSIGLIFLSKANFTPINYLKISLNEIVYRSSFIISIPEKKIQDLTNVIQNHYSVYRDYNETKKKLIQLESEKIENNYIIEENKRLKLLIDDYIYSSDEIIAKVFLDKKSPFLRSIIVNKGSKDNVTLGTAVWMVAI